ncbi:MAG TPA: hypothetical protein VD884_13425 [Ohtaekwangia sp.]|nr:hypothetical protein [Ohtaekwangia sp.]
MKTFNEILTEIIHEDHVYENETTVAPEERAAKEYAKQWVAKALNESVITDKTYLLVEMYDEEIDAQ